LTVTAPAKPVVEGTVVTDLGHVVHVLNHTTGKGGEDRRDRASFVRAWRTRHQRQVRPPQRHRARLIDRYGDIHRADAVPRR
jgi:hypothetical protein